LRSVPLSTELKDRPGGIKESGKNDLATKYIFLVKGSPSAVTLKRSAPEVSAEEVETLLKTQRVAQEIRRNTKLY
jgi:hypothetical protein